jgi:hypothetical protein
MADSLTQLATQLTQSIVPMIMVIGAVGSSLNIAILTRPALFGHACSRYFLALTCNDLFFTSVLLIYRLLADGYQLDATKISLISCKLITYIYQTSALLSPYFIVLASIDRYCASSTNANLRKFSNVKVTRWAILLLIIIIMLFYMNTAILVDLRQTDTFGCRIRADSIYKQIYAYIQIINFAIIAPGLMLMFGVMTIYNTKRVRVIPTGISRHRRTENQLARMLLLQVSIQIILTIPTCVTYLILVIPNTISSTRIFYFARIVSQLLLYLSFTTAFFLYTISAQIYRKELIKLVYKILRLRGGSEVHPSANTITNTIMPINRTAHTITTTRH